MSATLFAPQRIGSLVLPNALAVAPMTRISATSQGMPTDAMARYYERFAKGGFRLVITEGVYTDQAYSQGYLDQPGLSDAAQAEGWRPIVDKVHAAGGKIVAQLMHAGALAQGNRFRDHAAGPSAVRPRGTQMAFYRGEGPYRIPRELSEEDIREAIDGFAGAAARAIGIAGFDGIEIHGANGYLLDQFLTDYTNQRPDAWGGTITQRMRMAVEVARAVHDAVGAGVPVGMRISQAKVNDYTHKWAEGDDGAAIVFGALAEAKLDYIHITEYEAWRPAFANTGRSLVQLARAAAPGLAIIANGSLHDPARALEVMEQGANVIALGRGALANPAWPQLVGQGAPIREFDGSVLMPVAFIKASEIAG